MAKSEHRDLSPRDRQSSSKRRSDFRTPKARFLIICEGTKTEPNYFRCFPVPREIMDVRGTGRNTLSLVEEAIKIKKEVIAKARSNGVKKPFDQYWCVFDRDSFPPDQFTNAIEKAEANGFRVAYSNEAFELWYLLHFHYCDSALSRDQYSKPLSDHLGKPYAKGSTTIYNDIKHKQQDAIRNAKNILKRYDAHNPQADNPCTTVHLLVDELNKHIKQVRKL